VPGPFDGRRVGALETPVRIYDLSEGGCFITSFHDTEKGRQFTLKIDLPYEGWVTVKAETLYGKPGFGFAARFTEMTGEAQASLDRALAKLRARAPHEGEE
jgi:PilZ domain